MGWALTQWLKSLMLDMRINLLKCEQVDPKTHSIASASNFPDAECNRVHIHDITGKKPRYFYLKHLTPLLNAAFLLPCPELKQREGAKEARNTSPIKINLIFIQHFKQAQTLQQYLKPSTSLPVLPECCYKEGLMTCIRKLGPKNNVSQRSQLGKKENNNQWTAVWLLHNSCGKSSAVRSGSDPLHHWESRQALLQKLAIKGVR